MKRLLIIVEGDTEEEFVKTTLTKYLNTQGVYDVSAFKIKKSKGGLNKYSEYKNDVINVIYETNVVVTSLIDYYALPSDFPKYKEALAIPHKMERLDFLETAIKEDIERIQGGSFDNLLPYIQLHEFEALAFSSMNGFEQNFLASEANFGELQKLVNNYNPEEINDSPQTAPSKRLIKHIPGYDKVVFGNIIIESIGLETVMNECTRFNMWLEKLISLVKN